MRTLKFRNILEKLLMIAFAIFITACNKEEEPSFITLTTTKAVGEELLLLINAADTDRADIWIDLNNNGVKDSSETVTVFDSREEYTLEADTIKIYKKITELSCFDNQLTFLDVSKNIALTNLDCKKNQQTSLDVSKNTALRTLDCKNNQLICIQIPKDLDPFQKSNRLFWEWIKDDTAIWRNDGTPCS